MGAFGCSFLRDPCCRGRRTKRELLVRDRSASPHLVHNCVYTRQSANRHCCSVCALHMLWCLSTTEHESDTMTNQILCVLFSTIVLAHEVRQSTMDNDPKLRSMCTTALLYCRYWSSRRGKCTRSRRGERLKQERRETLVRRFCRERECVGGGCHENWVVRNGQSIYLLFPAGAIHPSLFQCHHAQP